MGIILEKNKVLRDKDKKAALGWRIYEYLAKNENEREFYYGNLSSANITTFNSPVFKLSSLASEGLQQISCHVKIYENRQTLQIFVDCLFDGRSR